MGALAFRKRLSPTLGRRATTSGTLRSTDNGIGLRARWIQAWRRIWLLGRGELWQSAHLFLQNGDPRTGSGNPGHNGRLDRTGHAIQADRQSSFGAMGCAARVAGRIESSRGARMADNASPDRATWGSYSTRQAGSGSGVGCRFCGWWRWHDQ